MTSEIVNRLRKNSECLAPSIMLDAADAIERLRAERDEARRSCCEFAAMVDSADTVLMYVDSNRFQEIAIRYMKSRGWDCFPREDKSCPHP